MVRKFRDSYTANQPNTPNTSTNDNDEDNDFGPFRGLIYAVTAFVLPFLIIGCLILFVYF